VLGITAGLAVLITARDNCKNPDVVVFRVVLVVIIVEELTCVGV
jgi:hypothetical protein